MREKLLPQTRFQDKPEQAPTYDKDGEADARTGVCETLVDELAVNCDDDGVGHVSR